MMKHFLLFVLAVAFAFSADADNRLSVDIKNAGAVQAVYANFIELFTADAYTATSVVTEGVSRFEIPDDGKTYIVMLSFERGAGLSQRMNILLMPGETVTIRGEMQADYLDYEVVGSPMLSAYAKHRKEASLKYEIELGRMIAALAQSNQQPDSVTALKMKDYADSIAVVQFEYVKAHPDQPLSVFYFLNGSQYAEQIYSMLDASLKEGVYKDVIAAQYKLISHNRKLNEVKEGAVAFDFNVEDINGKAIALADYKERYVVLDFWGSWCGWCMKGMPRMKEYYAKYKDKMEIVGMNYGDEPEKCKQTIVQESLSWRHICDSDAKLKTLYSVQTFPTKVVIDPQGNIAKVFVGESDEFYQFMDKVLQ